MAGYSTAADGLLHATVWNGTTPTELGTLPGGFQSFAVGINDRGQVVGYTDINGSNIATIWNGSDPTNLGTLPGGISSEALGINDLGDIVGYSFINGGTFDAVVWTPVTAVPEPSTWAMLLLGFAGIGFMAYRRKAKPLDQWWSALNFATIRSSNVKFSPHASVALRSAPSMVKK